MASPLRAGLFFGVSLMFGLFVSSRVLNTAACELVKNFSKTCPVGKVVPVNSVAAALDQLYANTGTLIQRHRWGIFARARLAKAVQRELQLLGYSPELVSRITSALIVNALVLINKTQKT
jgi:hypothetical protein